MVFSGAISPACKPCRDRRTRCDLRRPSCSQCRKAGRECNGYRDPKTIRLRFENDKVAARCAGPGSEHDDAQRSGDEAESSAAGPVVRRCHDSRPSMGARHLHQAYEDAALNFFFWCYADGGVMRYLRGIYASQSESSMLHKAVMAVSLECLSHQRPTPALQRGARANYCQALKEVNLALRGRVEDIGNDVITSITLLSLFMAVSADPEESPGRWVVHIDRALSIIMAQSRDQYTSIHGQYLLQHVMSMKQIACIQRGVPISDALKALYDSLLQVPKFQREFWEALHEVAVLRAAIDEAQAQSNVLQNAAKLDSKLKQLKDALPGVYQEQPRALAYDSTTEAMHLAFEYERAYSTVRMMQLSAAESACYCYLGGDFTALRADLHDQQYSSVPFLRERMALIEDVSMEILGSVARWCGELGRQTSKPRGSWCHSFLWPLVNIGKCPFAPRSLRDESRAYLKVLSEAVSAPEALAASERLETGSREEGWASALYLS